MIILPRGFKVTKKDKEACKQVSQEQVMSNLTDEEAQLLGMVKPETLDKAFQMLGIQAENQNNQEMIQ